MAGFLACHSVLLARKPERLQEATAHNTCESEYPAAQKQKARGLRNLWRGDTHVHVVAQSAEPAPVPGTVLESDGAARLGKSIGLEEHVHIAIISVQVKV